MEKILVVDDVAMNRMILVDMLEDHYEVTEADGGRNALKLLKEHYQEYGCVLLDLVMPEIDGFTVLEVMKKQGWLDEVPVIVISGEDSLAAEERSLTLGASDFIRKPFDEAAVHRRVKNITDLYSYKRNLERKVQEQTNTLQQQYQQLLKLAERIRQNNERIIDVLGMVVEYRDLESGEHIHRVKEYTEILAKEAMKEYPEYGLTEKKIQQITSASVLHDVGKIAIPDHILLKRGRLTQDEFEYMKTHASKGGELIMQIKGAWDAEFGKVCYEICRHHHEKYDGRGYPDGLKGEDIPLSAQLVSIADVYDALVSERIYKEAYPADQAFHMIISGECGMFSPKLLECFRNVRPKFEEVAKKHDFSGGGRSERDSVGGRP